MTDAITTTAQLIEQGYLVPTQVFARPAVLEHELHAGSVVEAYQSTCAGKRVIVFANTVVHAEYLAAQFNAAGILAYAVLARDNNAVRTAALESFSAGTCMVLVTINIDLSPAKADGVIIATPHNSARRYEHQIVSAMRPRFAPRQDDTDAMRRASIARSDKPVAMIIDLADNVLRHPEVIAAVTYRAKPDTHLTIPGSLEWDQTPEAAGQTDDALRANSWKSMAEAREQQMWAAVKERDTLAAQLSLLNPARIDTCKECGSKSLSWFANNTTGTSGIQNGRLRIDDVTCQFVLGCDDCSETLRVVKADTIAARLNADTQHAKDDEK